MKAFNQLNHSSKEQIKNKFRTNRSIIMWHGYISVTSCKYLWILHVTDVFTCRWINVDTNSDITPRPIIFLK